jgi:hypothetical protein
MEERSEEQLTVEDRMRINNMLVDMVLQREKDHRLTPEQPLRLPLLKEVTDIYLMTRDQQIREGNHIERTRKTTKKRH